MIWTLATYLLLAVDIASQYMDKELLKPYTSNIYHHSKNNKGKDIMAYVSVFHKIKLMLADESI